MKKPISELRLDIDKIDNEILRLIQERAKIAQEIGKIKEKDKTAVYRPDREQAIYEKINAKNQGPLSNEVLQAVYREIMSGIISLEKPIKIGYLGPKGSFSNQAVNLKFGQNIKSQDYSSIYEVFQSVENKKIDYGVVPIENSSEGLVNSTLDEFLHSSLKIYSEIYLKIVIDLIADKKECYPIQTLYGIPIAVAQCKLWIRENFPNVEIIQTNSTSKAAEIVAEKKKNCAAIASAFSANIYGLDILQNSIQDSKSNTTRFLVIGHDQCNSTKNDKTSVVFSIINKPGALYSILRIFNEQKINLTKLETRPTKSNPWEYNYFIDFEGHVQEEKVQIVLENLKKNSIFLKILGSYPISKNF